MSNTTTPPRREGGIELFRCLLMFIVVLHHCCVHGPLTSTWAAMLLFVITIPAVDAFVAISGWYGIRPSTTKFFKLIGLFAFYSLSIWFFMVTRWLIGVEDEFPRFSLSGGWFGAAYLALMLLAPILNAGLEALKETPRKLLGAWGLFALAIILNWGNVFNRGPVLLFPAFSVEGWSSHTFSSLMFVYVTVRTARLLNWQVRLKRYSLLLLCGMLLVLLASVPLRVLVGMPKSCLRVIGELGYNAPPIWITAILALFVFISVKPSNWVTRVATFLGPSMFGVYLFHESPLKEVLYQLPEVWLSDNYPWIPTAIIILACAVFTFVVSLCVDLLRRAGLSTIRWTWGKATHTHTTDRDPSPRLPA